MYSREIDDDVRSFGVTGKLWHGVLVMYDRESDSFWTQLDGRAIQGPSKGQRLTHVPSLFTTWGVWRELHPDTSVLEKTGDEVEQIGSNYAGYFSDPERTFVPHLAEGLGDEVGPKELVFGVKHDGFAVAVTESLLLELFVVNSEVGEEPVAFLLNRKTGGVRAVSRRRGDKLFELDPLPDSESGTQAVDLVSGEIVDTSELDELRVDRAFWYAWRRTHPQSSVVTLESYGQ